ncbi:hypothetical protein V8C42DRAFT_315354 [Trichoderma barbatum]
MLRNIFDSASPWVFLVLAEAQARGKSAWRLMDLQQNCGSDETQGKSLEPWPSSFLGLSIWILEAEHKDVSGKHH